MPRRIATHLEIEPARAKAMPMDRLEKLLKLKTHDVEEKLDGWRFLMHLGGGLDRVYMTGRRVSVKTGKLSEKGLCVPQLHPALYRGGYIVLDGEIMPPEGRSFRDLAGIMNVEPDKAADRIGKIGIPTYHVFDILFHDGKDVRKLPLKERSEMLDVVIASTFYKHPHVRKLKSLFDWMEGPVKSGQKIEFYEQVVEGGGEGLIVKDLTAPYGKGWIKWKKYSTLDVVITGFTDAKHGITGKYDGLIGAVVVSVYRGKKLVEVGQVSGMTDEVRKAISKRPRSYLGKVLEVKAQEMAKDRLRHPRWARLREDSDPRSCTWDKMGKDLKAGE